MPAAVAALLLLLLIAAQGGEPLRKTDVVRLLSSTTLAPDELAAFIRRNCLSFAPSPRDRADFVALGAEPRVLREIDTCVRRGPASRRVSAGDARAVQPPAPPGPRLLAAPVGAPAVPPVRRAPVSGVRTGFVLGVGQHATVGTPAPVPLLFDVRDTAGLPVPGEEVSLGVTNGRLGATRVAADTNGRVHVQLTLGPKAGPVQVTARVGPIERLATLYAEPGPAVKLVVRCGETSVEGRLSLEPRGAVMLRITAEDAFGNAAPIVGLQAAAGDRGVLRVAFVSGDSSGGLVRVEPGDEGSTSLVIVAARQRQDVSATVAQRPVPGAARCP